MLSVLSAAIIEAINNIFFLLGYVSNENSFPQPLTPDEETKYIELFKRGSEDAKNILIERNLRLVACIAKKYFSTGIDSEDLISIGSIGLIKAISTFDNTKGIKLATYAAKCIENEILMFIRKNARSKNEISLHEPVSVDGDGNETALIDLLENESESVVEKVELKMQIKRMYNKMKYVLKSREKNILELRYGLANNGSKTQMEIAEMFGISRSYVSRIETKAIGKLRKELLTDKCN